MQASSAYTTNEIDSSGKSRAYRHHRKTTEPAAECGRGLRCSGQALLRPFCPTERDPHHRVILEDVSRAVTPATLEVIIVQTLRGSIVCNRSDKEFRKLRLTRASIKLLCLPEGDGRFVSLVRIGSYEVRMLDVSQTGSADKPLFCLELFDHDAQTAVDNRVCYDIEEGVATFEQFISR